MGSFLNVTLFIWFHFSRSLKWCASSRRSSILPHMEFGPNDHQKTHPTVRLAPFFGERYYSFFEVAFEGMPWLVKSNKLSISSKALYYKINSLLYSKVRVEGHRFLRQGQLVPLKRGSKKTLREKILKEKIDIMVDKSQFLRNRVHQLEKLCNDHISNRDPRIKKLVRIFYMFH